MSRRHRFEFLLSSLPELEALGTPPPLSKLEYLERITDVHGPVSSVQMILLSDDLMLREALLADEFTVDQVEMAVLNSAPVDDSNDLPDYLLPDETESQDNARVAVDALWQRYFLHAHALAHHTGSTFLKSWIGFEVALRNGLVIARAQGLNLDPTPYLVTPELADSGLDTHAVISAWSSAPNPLAASETLDKARWEWIEEHGRWYSFQADELEAYAAKLILMHRWRRIAAEKTAEIGN
jgi:hypothetical protein